MSDSFTGAMAALSGGESTSAPAESPSASTSDQSTETTAPATAEPTSPTPETTPAPVQQQAQEPGPIPYPRFKEVNDERQTLRQQIEALKWAQGIQAEHGPSMAQFYSDLQRDPVGTLIREADAAAQANPAYAQQIRSAAARWLRMGGGQPQEAPMPEADLQTADGMPVYSAQAMQKVMAWQEQRLASHLTSQWQQQLQPLQQAHQQQQMQAQVQQIRAQANEWASQQIGSWQKRPYFQEHKADILAAMQNSKMSLAEAYVDVLTTKVLPKLSAQERSAVVSEMTSKAAAGSVNPARTPVASPAKFKSFGDALKHEFAAAAKG